ncbi:MAG: hypothetical protein CVV57_09530 [Tenericutes bacterium HGW-Tenericutes-2]|nr:MAG: hypothetical protein CVV57_09530 [Tenericutes bacterium HGW-Tenericutes-2]
MKKEKLFMLYFYVLPIMYIPLFIVYFRSSVLLNLFIFFSCFLILIFNFAIINKLKRLCLDVMFYKNVNLVNIIYIIGCFCLAIFVFLSSLTQYLPGGV